MALTTVLALAAGIYAAARHNKLGDVGVMAPAQVGIAIPNFWFAILLILLFSVHLQWVRRAASRAGAKRRRPVEGLQGAAAAGHGAGRGAGGHPGAHHALGRAGGAARGLRAHRARQGPEPARQALWGHVLRNAMIPVLTVMGLQFANLLAGTIVVENVFYLPGMGRLIFQSISNRDLIVVRNCVMLLAAMVVIVNFVVDVLYAVIDPRVKASDI
jgi:peptide/nickel transport system permease protein